MTKIEEAREVLDALGYFAMRSSELPPLTLLALAGLKRDMPWSQAQRRELGISRGIMQFMREHYDRVIKENTRETIRDEILKVMLQAGIVARNPGHPEIPTNSSRNFYALTAPALSAILRFGAPTWNKYLSAFRSSSSQHVTATQLRQRRSAIPVTIQDGKALYLTASKHGDLIADVITSFASFFARDAHVLFVSDTADRNIWCETAELDRLGIHLDLTQSLPDLILFDPVKKRLFWIEAVTSSGPVNDLRLAQLQQLSHASHLAQIYITAFANFNTFSRFASEIAWETEVWIAERPDHIVHYNGDSYL